MAPNGVRANAPWAERTTRVRAVAGLLGLALLSACATPGAGPVPGGVESSARRSPVGSVPVVDLAALPLSYSPDYSGDGLARLAGRRFDASTLRAGDTIDVKIFDTGESGLISSADSKALELGTFKVDQRGQVNLPFVGRLRAAGSSSAALQDRIAAGLRGSSVSPQASVFVSEAGGSGFTVSGAVNGAGQFKLTSQGERVLDAIALAGGPAGAPGDTEVTVIRGADQASVGLDRLLAESRQNIYVQPGDQIFLKKQSTSYTAFGAFKSPGEFAFEPGSLSLAQAVARSGGLLDDRANPSELYLFRYEPAAVARSIGALPAGDMRASPVPVTYRIDMTKTPSFFQMQSFPMRKGDLLYVPNTRSAEIGKIFQIFQKSPPTAAAPLPE
jgi:polysaccharide biosynthesis/export protein